LASDRGNKAQSKWNTSRSRALTGLWSRPLFLVSDFGVAKELARFRMQEDRVARNPVVLEDLLQFQPDRTMVFFV
jgi:hypothetical protein